MNDKFSDNLCGFRKGHNTQHMLLKLIEDWRKCLDKGGVVGTILLDLSKAFDSLSHDLLLSKLEAYGFSSSALKLMTDYLKNRFQRVEVGSKFSSWLKILAGVPQGSVLGPILFNIFISDIFFILPNLKNFADDNTISVQTKSIKTTTIKLSEGLNTALLWFKENELLVNPGKFQLMYLGHPDPSNYCLEIGNQKPVKNIFFFGDNALKIKNRIIIKPSCVKLLGVHIDSKLTFNIHIDNLCSKAKNSVNCLRRTSSLHTFRKYMKLLVDTFFMSTFSTAP